MVTGGENPREVRRLTRAIVRPEKLRTVLAVLATVAGAAAAMWTMQPANHGAAAPAATVVAEQVWALPAGKADETRLQRYAILTNRAVSAAFPQIEQIAGHRPDPINGHGTGVALDILLPSPTDVDLGNQIRDYVMTNAHELGVDYVVWRQTLFTPDGDVNHMRDRGGLTSNAFDHLHVHTKGGGYP